MRNYVALRTILGVAGATVLFPEVVAAEVMDKEPTLAGTCGWSLIGGTLGFLGWRFRWWAGASVALLPATYFVALHSELSDPYVGPAIVAEAGLGYVVGSYCAAIVFVLMHAAGMWSALRGRSVAS